MSEVVEKEKLNCQHGQPGAKLPSASAKARPSWIIFRRSTLHFRDCGSEG
jgi:hypothetical protein